MCSERSSNTPTVSPSRKRLCLRPRELKKVLPCESFLAVPHARPQDLLPMGHVLIPMTPCDLMYRVEYTVVLIHHSRQSYSIL